MSCEICKEYSLSTTGVCKPFFCQGQDSRYLGFAGNTASVLIIQFCSEKAAIDNTKQVRANCDPVKLYFYTLEANFHVSFMCYEV